LRRKSYSLIGWSEIGDNGSRGLELDVTAAISDRKDEEVETEVSSGSMKETSAAGV
jgi:hypothetical protein